MWRALFPSRCPGCGARGEPVCAECARTLRGAPPAATPPDLDAWYAAFAYVGPARELVARIKYRGCRAALPWLAERLVALVRPHGVDVVTWVPTTRPRRRSRGFDHAELLARALARSADLPARRLLARMDAVPQTGRSLAQRRSGPRFRVLRPLIGARVLVVDDVATTGATLGAAARALREVGAARVVAVTAARTPSRRSSASVHSTRASADRLGAEVFDGDLGAGQELHGAGAIAHGRPGEGGEDQPVRP